METDLEQADLDATVCWEHAMASGDPEYIGTAYNSRLNLLHAQGDQRRLLEHARDHHAWSAVRDGPGPRPPCWPARCSPRGT